jgi:hypothetical protein
MGQALIADAAFAALQGGTTAVPEPGNWSLVVFALLCLGGASLAKRYSKK